MIVRAGRRMGSFLRSALLAATLLALVPQATAARRRRLRGRRNATLPSDPTCHARDHAGYAGDMAVVWGANLRLSSAAECCRACQAHAAACGRGNAGAEWWGRACGRAPGCNLWSFCPEEQCFAFDIHVHRRGECWLKQQAEAPTRPKDPFEGHAAFPPEMRAAPRRSWPFAVSLAVWPGPMPERVPWISGVLAPAGEVVVSGRPNDRWRERWCTRHGPCTEVADAADPSLDGRIGVDADNLAP